MRLVTYCYSLVIGTINFDGFVSNQNVILMGPSFFYLSCMTSQKSNRLSNTSWKVKNVPQNVNFQACSRAPRLGAKGRPSRQPSMPGIEGGREGRPLAPKWVEVHRLGAKGRPSMPGIEGRREGRPLVPKRRRQDKKSFS